MLELSDQSGKVGDLLIQAFATLVGALAAFGLEALRKNKEKQREQVQQMKAGVFTLVSQRTFLVNMLSQHLEPLRENPGRHFLLRPTWHAAPTDALDVQALGFLLSKGDPDLLNRLVITEAKYKTFLTVLERRNATHIRFQERLEVSANSTGASSASFSDLARIAGPRASSELRESTNSLFELVEDAIDSNRKACDGLSDAVKTLYPKEKMFTVRDLPPSNEHVARKDSP